MLIRHNQLLFLLATLFTILTPPSLSYNPNPNTNRKAFLQTLTSTAATVAFAPRFATAKDDDDELTNVYFGVGCFWHIQHEFIEAERRLLNRGDKELTSLAGYAGGLKADKEGRVCYHNFQGVADYGKLGHGEVVGMTIPQSSIGDFAKEYFSLFRNGERVDPQDRGGEYRSLLGLPGGTSHPSYPLVEDAATSMGMKLEKGRGNDPDTLGKKLVYVMDSNDFPFYQAEFYHQYHNDFQSPPYGKKYNSLAEVALEDGRIKVTGCPDRVPKENGMTSPTTNSGRSMAFMLGCFILMSGIFVYLLKKTRNSTRYELTTPEEKFDDRNII